MQLVWRNAEQTLISVTLAAGDVLGAVVGPIDGATVPADPNNREYQEIQRLGLTIAPFVPPPPPEPQPDALALAERANQRLDAGIEAALPKIDEADEFGRAVPRRGETMEDLQAQIDLLRAAMEVMLVAQKGPQPRQPPAPTRRARR